MTAETSDGTISFSFGPGNEAAEAVPDGPPRAVAEYWHAAALERSDNGRDATWTIVAHVAATILSAMHDETNELQQLLEQLGRPHTQWAVRLPGGEMSRVPDVIGQARYDDFLPDDDPLMVRKVYYGRWQIIAGCPCPQGMKFHALNCPVVPGQPTIVGPFT